MFLEAWAQAAYNVLSRVCHITLYTVFVCGAVRHSPYPSFILLIKLHDKINV